eukprot:CAMPEP_0206423034 /NCGR_PEP_ID=MMETSP0324_2-20121206/2450_1 /ASSEMBLY_ACC=CAM_ASM_000836 /TAXON_ID=2866 /ORGANISM="Crypthecodinium cohnii, Strain Seligo" /LENGTH=106 /DNA_ID=CAMNT_0053887537 /DNA_START=50 /DNA_END=367 /DNA_ORIENTATION=-
MKLREFEDQAANVATSLRHGFEGLVSDASSFEHKLGTKDSLLMLILNIAILTVIVLVALFLLWGGTTKELQADPVGSLTKTAHKVEANLEQSGLIPHEHSSPTVSK